MVKGNLLKKEKFDVIFMDPPYYKNMFSDALLAVDNNELLKEDGIFITSGIINTMEEAVKEAMLANNFEILEINHMKDWVSITAKPKR